MKAVDMEFDSRMHDDCRGEIKLMRSVFLIVSLLHRLSLTGVPGGHREGSMELPSSLVFICSDYLPTTARDIVTVQGHICNECFALWATNIKSGWLDAVDRMNRGIHYNDIGQVHHAINNLLKYDP